MQLIQIQKIWNLLNDLKQSWAMAQAGSQPSKISPSLQWVGNVAISERVEYILKGQDYWLVIVRLSEALRFAGKRSLTLNLGNLVVSFYQGKAFCPLGRSLKSSRPILNIPLAPLRKFDQTSGNAKGSSTWVFNQTNDKQSVTENLVLIRDFTQLLACSREGDQKRVSD